MSKLEGFDLRYTNAMDIIYLRQWLSDPKVLMWFPMANQAEIEQALTAWMFFSKYQASLTATLQHIPCGMATLFLMPYKKIRHQASCKICVDPTYWGKGIGSSLIKNLKHLAENYFHLEGIYTEVMADNPIIPLLKNFGFYEMARQEEYFHTPEGYKARVCLIVDLQPAKPGI